ncbi:MAG: hypothetical protein H6849_03460 [Alphaproteobacteria bacterium]|nr:MAG: hypothetical protein H6849_03460 [Alphaproteobacteria bacterium]
MKRFSSHKSPPLRKNTRPSLFLRVKKTIGIISRDIYKTLATFRVWQKSLRPTQIVFVHDVGMMALASLGPLGLINPEHFSLIGVWFIMRYACVYGLVSIAVFIWLRPNRHSWKYLSSIDIMRVILSIFYVNALFFILQAKLLSLPDSAIRISLLTSIISFVFLALPRFLYYAFHKNWLLPRFFRNEKKVLRALVIGATDDAERYLRHTSKYHQSPYEIVGILDDTSHKRGQSIHGISVIGAFSDLQHILRHYQRRNKPINTLLIADISMYGPAVRPLVALQEIFAIDLLRITGVNEMTKSFSEKISPRPLLLENFRTDAKLPASLTFLQKKLKDKSVMIIGANHGISPSLWRAFVTMEVSRLSVINYTRHENPDLQSAITQSPSHVHIKTYMNDLSSKTTLTRILKEELPDFIIVAAEFVSEKNIETQPAQSFHFNISPLILARDCIQKIATPHTVLLSSIQSPSTNESSADLQWQLLEQSYMASLNKTCTILRLPPILEDPYGVPATIINNAMDNQPIFLDKPDTKSYFQSQKNAATFVLNGLQVYLQKRQPLIISPVFEAPVNICEAVHKTLNALGIHPDFDQRIHYATHQIAPSNTKVVQKHTEKSLASTHQGLRLFTPHNSSITIHSGLSLLVKNAREGNDFAVEKYLRSMGNKKHLREKRT